jgi:predicted pyridoxine 5'-phosphate oxidase superfamily flavin-nucleotide-binding protein
MNAFTTSPPATFHEGERALQQMAGVRERMAEIGPRAIRDFMPAQHRDFFAQLPLLIAGSIDDDGRPWASLLAGPPGFAGAPDPRRLAVSARPLPGSPLAAHLRPGAPLGLLGIEAHTRRRNRMNGVVGRVDADGFDVQVEQSFGNCPKYIRTRQARFVDDVVAPGDVERMAALDASARALVTAADTLFIASRHPAAGVDVSHRGGAPGFVRVDDEGTLTLPDYAGNLFFNTLGNLQVDPRAGLLFIDFERGDLLHVAATARLVWEGPELAAFGGAQRLLRLTVDQVVRVTGGLPLAWTDLPDR